MDEVLASEDGVSGAVDYLLPQGSGDYELELIVVSTDSVGGPGVATFSDAAVTIEPIDIHFTSVDMRNLETWDFIDESDNGSVTFSSPSVAELVGGDDSSGAQTRTYIQRTFRGGAGHDLLVLFDWEFTSLNAAGYDYPFWEIVDVRTGQVLDGESFMTAVSGDTGAVRTAVPAESGEFVIRLGVVSTDNQLGAGFATFSNFLSLLSSGFPFVNPRFELSHGGGWPLVDESQTGSISTAGDVLTVTGGDDVATTSEAGFPSSTWAQQNFRFAGGSDFRLSFDWTYGSSNVPGFDQAQWDLIDAKTERSLISGPLTLAISDASGSVDQLIAGGSGRYVLRVGVHSSDNRLAPGVATFDNFELNQTAIALGVPFELTAANWQFVDESNTGTVSYLSPVPSIDSGFIAVTGGNDGFDRNSRTWVQRSFRTSNPGWHRLRFLWEFQTLQTDFDDIIFYDVIDVATGSSALRVEQSVFAVNGETGIENAYFNGTGEYVIRLGVNSRSNLGGSSTAIFSNLQVLEVKPDDSLSPFTEPDGRILWQARDESRLGRVTYDDTSTTITNNNQFTFFATGPHPDSWGFPSRTWVQQPFRIGNGAPFRVRFDWAFSTDSIEPGENWAFWDVIDLDRNESLLGGPEVLADTDGTSGTVNRSIPLGEGRYLIRLGTASDDTSDTEGETTFELPQVTVEPIPPFRDGDFTSVGAWNPVVYSGFGSVAFFDEQASLLGPTLDEPNHSTGIRQVFRAGHGGPQRLRFDWEFDGTGPTGTDVLQYSVRHVDATTFEFLDSGASWKTIASDDAVGVEDVEINNGSGLFALEIRVLSTDFSSAAPGIAVIDNVSVSPVDLAALADGTFSVSPTTAWFPFGIGSGYGPSGAFGGELLLQNPGDLFLADGVPYDFPSLGGSQQAFRAGHGEPVTLSFDWETVGDTDGTEATRYDVLDVRSGYSLIGGAQTLAEGGPDSGTESISFCGDGQYLLRFLAESTDSRGEPSGGRFDNVTVTPNSYDGLVDGDFSDPTGASWCFYQGVGAGNVDYSTGQAIVTGLSASDIDIDHLDVPYVQIQQAFQVVGPSPLSFNWSYTTLDDPTYEAAYWDLIDLDTGASAIGGPIVLANTPGLSGSESIRVPQTGNYLICFGVINYDGVGPPGVATFDDLMVGPPPCDVPLDVACSFATDQVNLSWTNGEPYASIDVLRSGAFVESLPGTATSTSDTPPPGVHSYTIVGNCSTGESGVSAPCSATVPCPDITSLSCAASDDDATLTWTTESVPSSFVIERDGALLVTLPGSTTSFIDAALPIGTYSYSVFALCDVVGAGPPSPCSVEILDSEPRFIRGDANSDQVPDVSDAVYLLENLFLFGPELDCQDAGDANDDGLVDVSDPAYLLAYLFASGAPPPPPFTACGEDATSDGLDCLNPVCP